MHIQYSHSHIELQPYFYSNSNSDIIALVITAKYYYIPVSQIE